jgi:hypothetical protein
VGTERGRAPRDIRKERWEAVKKEAFVRVGYERNAERLLAELGSRDAAAAMRAYADEIDARAAALKAPATQAALRLEEVTSCSHEELQPHMHSWSTYGPYRTRHGLPGMNLGPWPQISPKSTRRSRPPSPAGAPILAA